jgi:glycosyltransferase involved in cell wall biosynthesis
MIRDSVTDVYHVPNPRTADFIKQLTDKPIHVIPYWANQKIWYPSKSSKSELRKRLGIPTDSYVIGSFQRDTEGRDLRSPKLEKGPDLLCDFIENRHKLDKSVFVVLAGWRRQYVCNRLVQANVPYKYFEKPQLDVVRDLYQLIDLYPVTSRYEGGPQSLIECGLMGIPVVSRPVGIAEQVLPPSAINKDVSCASPTVPNVEHLKLPRGYEPYVNLIETLC